MITGMGSMFRVSGQWEVWVPNNIQVSQELRSLLRDLIPELILNQKRHTHTWVQFTTVQEL